MNVGYEDEQMKPFIEPQPDYKDPRRTGVCDSHTFEIV